MVPKTLLGSLDERQRENRSTKHAQDRHQMAGERYRKSVKETARDAW